MGYAYDTLNRLTAVTEGGVTQASYTYDTNGNRSGMTLANGVSTDYTYNAANWITSLTNTQNGNTLSSFDYTYYPSGNQASKTDQNGVVTTYEYDGLGRLTRESEQGGLTVNYAFDAAGNRSGMVVTGTENYTVSYNYDANNRLISSLYTGSTTQSSYYTYDACGNLLTAAEWRPQDHVASAANYGYNGFNQLATQTVNDVSSSFAYNASGIRTAKLTGNTLTGYLLDGGNVVAELEDDELTASYLRGANLISRTTSATEYYTFNAHGDVVGLVSAAGTQTKTYDYDAFGNEKDRVGSDPNPFRYCGEYFDVESGAYYLRARYYDPSVGRFTQEDTHWNASNMIYGDEPQQIGEYEDPLGTSRYVYAPKVSAIKQAANQYGYGLANPVYYCDRNGKMGEMALQWSAGMWWLTLIDGVLPVGDVIYVVGIGVLSIADAINTFGADNVVSLITDAPNVLSESIRSLSHWVQNIGKGGTVPNPGDPNWGKGFKSFRQLKKFLGSPGKGKEWHHIVEQCQEKSTRAGFSSQQIQNTNNVISISKEVHKQISAFYSRVPDTMLVDTGGMTFRDWLSTMSFAEQYEWGIWVLRYFGVEI